MRCVHENENSSRWGQAWYAAWPHLLLFSFSAYWQFGSVVCNVNFMGAQAKDFAAAPSPPEDLATVRHSGYLLGGSGPYSAVWIIIHTDYIIHTSV